MAKLLVVDDEQMTCDLLRKVLSAHHHVVIAVTDGRQAVAAYKKHRPEITLLDVCMPGYDGIEVLRDIRAMNPLARVIMLTGADSQAMENEARILGATDFIRKRVALDELVGALDRIAGQAAPASAQSAAASMGAQPVQAPSPADVLVVDDEELVRSLLQQYLTMKGYRVRLAQDGPSALQQVHQESPQMIILDMYMPGMNGLETLRELRKRHYGGGVVALTASQDEQLLKRTMDLGPVDVLAKPVDLERLDLVLQVGLAITQA